MATQVSDVEDFSRTVLTNYIGVASYTVLVWDHLITFADEVRYVWNGRKGPLIWLFFLNRYLTPLAFIVNLYAYFSPVWTPTHFVRYEGSMTLIGINVTALMMLLRVYAMYGRNKVVLSLLSLVLAVECSVNAWLLTKGVPVMHGVDIHSCTMIFEGGPITAASAWLPLLYDTTVLLTFYRHLVLQCDMQRDARSDHHDRRGAARLKNITAQTEYLLTVAMMSRITLHLKKRAHHPHDDVWGSRSDSDSVSSTAPQLSSVHVATHVSLWDTQLTSAERQYTHPAVSAAVNEAASVTHDDCEGAPPSRPPGKLQARERSWSAMKSGTR
ncbi:hypothetical protein A0H81_08567 [Grifola frondosa]|uniref:DUF6533 domain-containing protein n=1 Tax=Grifola frondosa TaxID=5627 RepID=A0A1C7M874_GRIFR|nr:hypothetical protein A0H81_08567 [Grifola frondosa]